MSMRKNKKKSNSNFIIIPCIPQKSKKKQIGQYAKKTKEYIPPYE